MLTAYFSLSENLIIMSVEAGLCKSILLEDFGVHTAVSFMELNSSATE